CWVSGRVEQYHVPGDLGWRAHVAGGNRCAGPVRRAAHVEASQGSTPPPAMRSAKVILLLTIVMMAGGCEDSPAGLPVVRMKIGSQTFNLEVARTEAQQEKGLMKRDSMPADHGMIFVFPEELERSFWMKNTRFPMDILFLNSAGKIVSIHQMR